MKNIVLTLLLLLPMPLLAKEGATINWAKHFYQSIISPDDSIIKKFIELESQFDFDSFFNLTIQDISNKLSAEELSAFKTIFRNVFVKNILENHFQSDIKKLTQVSFSSREIGINKSIVSISGLVDNKSLKMNLYVTNEQNTYKVTDIAVSGAELSTNYRAQFNRIFRVEGYSGLVTRLQNTLNSKEI